MEFKRPKIRRIKSKEAESVEQAVDIVEDSEKNIKSLVHLTQKIQTRALVKRADLAEKAVVEHTKEHFIGRLSSLRGVRNFVFAWLFLMFSLLISLAVNQFIGRANYKHSVYSLGGSYSEGFVSSVDSLNPLFASSEAEKAFSYLAFSRLYSTDTSGSIKGQVATEILTQDDKKYTVKIRDDIVWSDGQKLTVDDVVFTTELFKNPTLALAQYPTWKNIKVNKLDDYSLDFELTGGAKNFIYFLDFAILPEHILKEVPVESLRENSFNEQPITSGPFKFKMMQQVKSQPAIHLEANENYFLGRPKLDRFEIRTYSDKDSLHKALLDGEVSALPGVSLQDLNYKTTNSLKESKNNINRGIYAFLNQADPVLSDIKVRQAIQRGIDVKEIREKIGNPNPLDLPILNNFLGDIDLYPAEYNQKVAENLLDQAGWTISGDNKIRQKDQQNLTINVVAIKGSQLEQIAEIMNLKLKEIGFEVNLQIVDLSDKATNFIQTILQPRQYGILIYEIDLGADPDIFAFWHSSQATANGFNLSNYKDFISDDILASTRNMDNGQLRQAKYESFIRRWLNNVPAIGIAQSQFSYTYRSSVETFNQNNKLVKELDRYADVIYWQASKAEVYKTP